MAIRSVRHLHIIPQSTNEIFLDIREALTREDALKLSVYLKQWAEYGKEAMRVRAHSISETEYMEQTQELISQTIRLLYRDQQVYTHIDVYSPLRYGENLMFRVKL